MKNEVIITSNSKNNSNKNKNKFNSAPIGVYYKENKEILIYIYSNSHTYDNLKENNYFIINITNNYNLAKYVIDDGKKEDYSYLNSIPYLKDSYKIQLVKIKNRKITNINDNIGENNIMIITGIIELEKIINNKPLEPYNRSEGLIVEMAVLYSRLNIVNNETKIKIKNEMEHYYKTIKKVGNKKYIKLAERLLNY